MNIMILACGKMKKGALSELISHYHKQIHWSVKIKEINISESDPVTKNHKENKEIKGSLLPEAYVIALDETGKDFKSREIAGLIDQQQQSSTKHIQIIIGGVDGLNPETLNKAHVTLRFGQQTWPHKLVRVMLYEQLYRVQSILDSHPYHRD